MGISYKIIRSITMRWFANSKHLLRSKFIGIWRDREKEKAERQKRMVKISPLAAPPRKLV